MVEFDSETPDNFEARDGVHVFTLAEETYLLHSALNAIPFDHVSRLKYLAGGRFLIDYLPETGQTERMWLQSEKGERLLVCTTYVSDPSLSRSVSPS